MPENVTLLVWATAVGLVCWMVRTVMRHAEDNRQAAQQAHVLAVLERERCERLRDECREAVAQCDLAASVAHDAAADAEEYAESVEPLDDLDDPDDEDGFRRY